MARRKFQKRTAEPRPDLGPSVFEGLGCLTLLALPTVVAVLAWRGGIYAVTVVLSLLVAAFVGHFVYGRGSSWQRDFLDGCCKDVAPGGTFAVGDLELTK